jgi:hypothetical protein
MGVRWRTAEAALVAAILCAAARARGSVQVEPIARLSLEGGYDSNVLYDGRGGNDMGRVSPDLGVHLRDHTYSLTLLAGGDLLMYGRESSTVWNQRGEGVLAARLTPRLSLDAEARGTYAFDPIGLARVGIFSPRQESALLLGGKARLAWRSDHRWTFAGTFEDHVLRFSDGAGAASFTPGVEATRRLDRRLEAGGTYRFDVFQGYGADAGRGAYAHEALGIARWRWARRVVLEATGGAALWRGQTGTWLLPQAGVQLFGQWRRADLRLSLRHGVGLGIDARPGLFDSAEVGVTLRLGRSWLVHGDGGLWRAGAPPWGSDAVLGYGVEGEIAYRLTRELRLGLAASRFARADLASSRFDRNIVGLRMTWEPRHR